MPTLTRKSIQDVALIFILAAMGTGVFIDIIVTVILTGRISWLPAAFYGLMLYNIPGMLRTVKEWQTEGKCDPTSAMPNGRTVSVRHTNIQR